VAPPVRRSSPTAAAGSDVVVAQLPVVVTRLGESSGGGGGGGALGGLLSLSDGTLEALLSAKVAAVLEHVARVRMKRPVTALTYSDESLHSPSPVDTNEKKEKIHNIIRQRNNYIDAIQCSYMPHMAINDLTINFRHDDSQTQHRSHTASLDFVVKTVSKNLDSCICIYIVSE